MMNRPHDESETDRFLSGLHTLLGESGLLRAEGLLDRYSCDWTQKNKCPPIAVARPRSTQEVATVLRYCHERRWPVVVQGGMTGLVGGATPRQGELALSLERLNEIGEPDLTSATIIASAGASLAAVQERALGEGMCFPVDLASRGTCTIGGVVATNAGGNRVIRYGMTRQLVLGLEGVLADGTVVSSLNTIIKDNAGYDIKQLFIGTEGTLGVVTRASLRLFPEPPERMTLLTALPSYESLTSLLRFFRRRMGSQLSAFEAMWDSYFECALAIQKIERPFQKRHAFYALAEVEMLNPEVDRSSVEGTLADALASGQISDAIVAHSLAEAKSLWRIRECAGELLGRLAPAAAHDISLPITQMDRYATTVEQRFQREMGGDRIFVFGHLGDGNLHLMTPLRKAEDAPALDKIVYESLPAGSSVSAEHGIGTLKKPWLGLTRSPPEMALMRSLKQHLDPRGILNRGRVI